MLLVNPFTALALFEIAHRRRHRAVVNTAAASALGGMLTRLGIRYHIPIIHLVRRKEQVDVVRGRGGDIVLNSSSPDFTNQLYAAVQQQQATLFLDAIGGSMTQTLADAAPFGSTILLYARLSGQNSEIDPRTIYLKHLQVQGFFLSNWVQAKNLLQILRLSQQAQSLIMTDLHTSIRARLPLASVQQAVDMYRRDMTAGKILLVAHV